MLSARIVVWVKASRQADSMRYASYLDRCRKIDIYTVDTVDTDMPREGGSAPCHVMDEENLGVYREAAS